MKLVQVDKYPRVVQRMIDTAVKRGSVVNGGISNAMRWLHAAPYLAVWYNADGEYEDERIFIFDTRSLGEDVVIPSHCVIIDRDDVTGIRLFVIAQVLRTSDGSAPHFAACIWCLSEAEQAPQSSKLANILLVRACTIQILSQIQPGEIPTCCKSVTRNQISNSSLYAQYFFGGSYGTLFHLFFDYKLAQKAVIAYATYTADESEVEYLERVGGREDEHTEDMSASALKRIASSLTGWLSGSKVGTHVRSQLEEGYCWINHVSSVSQNGILRRRQHEESLCPEGGVVDIVLDLYLNRSIPFVAIVCASGIMFYKIEKHNTFEENRAILVYSGRLDVQYHLETIDEVPDNLGYVTNLSVSKCDSNGLYLIGYSQAQDSFLLTKVRFTEDDRSKNTLNTTLKLLRVFSPNARSFTSTYLIEEETQDGFVTSNHVLSPRFPRPVICDAPHDISDPLTHAHHRRQPYMGLISTKKHRHSSQIFMCWPYVEGRLNDDGLLNAAILITFPMDEDTSSNVANTFESVALALPDNSSVLSTLSTTQSGTDNFIPISLQSTTLGGFTGLGSIRGGSQKYPFKIVILCQNRCVSINESIEGSVSSIRPLLNEDVREDTNMPEIDEEVDVKDSPRSDTFSPSDMESNRSSAVAERDIETYKPVTNEPQLSDVTQKRNISPYAETEEKYPAARESSDESVRLSQSSKRQQISGSYSNKIMNELLPPFLTFMPSAISDSVLRMWRKCMSNLFRQHWSSKLSDDTVSSTSPPSSQGIARAVGLAVRTAFDAINRMRAVAVAGASAADNPIPNHALEQMVQALLPVLIGLNKQTIEVADLNSAILHISRTILDQKPTPRSGGAEEEPFPWELLCGKLAKHGLLMMVLHVFDILDTLTDGTRRTLAHHGGCLSSATCVLALHELAADVTYNNNDNESYDDTLLSRNRDNINLSRQRVHIADKYLQDVFAGFFNRSLVRWRTIRHVLDWCAYAIVESHRKVSREELIRAGLHHLDILYGCITEISLLTECLTEAISNPEEIIQTDSLTYSELYGDISMNNNYNDSSAHSSSFANPMHRSIMSSAVDVMMTMLAGAQQYVTVSHQMLYKLYTVDNIDTHEPTQLSRTINFDTSEDDDISQLLYSGILAQSWIESLQPSVEAYVNASHQICKYMLLTFQSDIPSIVGYDTSGYGLDDTLFCLRSLIPMAAVGLSGEARLSPNEFTSYSVVEDAWRVVSSCGGSLYVDVCAAVAIHNLSRTLYSSAKRSAQQALFLALQPPIPQTDILVEICIQQCIRGDPNIMFNTTNQRLDMNDFTLSFGQSEVSQTEPLLTSTMHNIFSSMDTLNLFCNPCQEILGFVGGIYTWKDLEYAIVALQPRYILALLCMSREDIVFRMQQSEISSTSCLRQTDKLGKNFAQILANNLCDLHSSRLQDIQSGNSTNITTGPSLNHIGFYSTPFVHAPLRLLMSCILDVFSLGIQLSEDPIERLLRNPQTCFNTLVQVMLQRGYAEQFSIVLMQLISNESMWKNAFSIDMFPNRQESLLLLRQQLSTASACLSLAIARGQTWSRLQRDIQPSLGQNIPILSESYVQCSKLQKHPDSQESKANSVNGYSSNVACASAALSKLQVLLTRKQNTTSKEFSSERFSILKTIQTSSDDEISLFKSIAELFDMTWRVIESTQVAHGIPRKSNEKLSQLKQLCEHSMTIQRNGIVQTLEEVIQCIQEQFTTYASTDSQSVISNERTETAFSGLAIDVAEVLAQITKIIYLWQQSCILNIKKNGSLNVSGTNTLLGAMAHGMTEYIGHVSRGDASDMTLGDLNDASDHNSLPIQRILFSENSPQRASNDTRTDLVNNTTEKDDESVRNQTGNIYTLVLQSALLIDIHTLSREYWRLVDAASEDAKHVAQASLNNTVLANVAEMLQSKQSITDQLFTKDRFMLVSKEVESFLIRCGRSNTDVTQNTPQLLKLAQTLVFEVLNKQRN